MGRPAGSKNINQSIVDDITTQQTKRKKAVNDDITIRCPMCGERKVFSAFYKSKSPLYANNHDHLVFCKECVLSTYESYWSMIKDVKNSVFITCLKFDLPFSESDYDGMIKQVMNDNSAHPMRIYIQKINSLGGLNNGLTGFNPLFLLEDKTAEDEKKSNDTEHDIKLTDQDLQVKEDVIRLIGYDPFAGYSEFDQKFLYNELISYLDEDTLEDAFKLSMILQLVNNNNQVRKIDLVIANMSNDTKSLITYQGDIKSLSATKKSIVDNIDKIAKENSISVKNRGDKKAGKSTLTYMMKNLRELGFENAEHDYYDHMKAIGMKRTADISNKSILEQLQFDENDYVTMLKEQKEIIQNLQDKIYEIEEENRQLHVNLDNL